MRVDDRQWVDAGATFEPDGHGGMYRYDLWRVWDVAEPPITWLMLNPSMANEKSLDPTLRRCIGYSMEWGFGSMWVVNLYALVSTDPRALPRHSDPAGPRNDKFIFDRSSGDRTVMVGWGRSLPRGGITRVRQVHRVLHRANARMMMLKEVEGGMPSHPLYLPKTLHPIPWDAKRALHLDETYA